MWEYLFLFLATLHHNVKAEDFIASDFVGNYIIDDSCDKSLCCCFVGTLRITQENDGSIRVTIFGDGIDGNICPPPEGQGDLDALRNGSGDIVIPINLDPADPDMFMVSVIGIEFIFRLNMPTNPKEFDIEAPQPECSSKVNQVVKTSPPTANPNFIGDWVPKKRCPSDCNCCPSGIVRILSEKDGSIDVSYPTDDCNNFQRTISAEDAAFDSFPATIHSIDFVFTINGKSSLTAINTDDDTCQVTFSRDHTVDTSSLNSLEILYIAFAGGCVLLMVICYFVFRASNPKAKNLIVFRAGFAFLDFVSDCFFVYEVFRLFPSLKYYALAFVVAPAIINIFLLVRIFMFETQSKKMKRWFDNHSSVATAVLFLSCTKLDVISILYSEIMNLHVFKMPFSEVSRARVEWYGIVGNIIEDFPQFTLQMVVVAEAGGITSPFIGVSIVTTLFSIVFEIIRRCLIFTFRRFDFDKRGHAPTDAESSIGYKPLPNSSEHDSVNSHRSVNGKKEMLHASLAHSGTGQDTLVARYEDEMRNSVDMTKNPRHSVEGSPMKSRGSRQPQTLNTKNPSISEHSPETYTIAVGESMSPPSFPTLSPTPDLSSSDLEGDTDTAHFKDRASTDVSIDGALVQVHERLASESSIGEEDFTPQPQTIFK